MLMNSWSHKMKGWWVIIPTRLQAVLTWSHWLINLSSSKIESSWPNSPKLHSTTYGMGFPCGSAGKESTCNAEDPGSIPGLGRSPGKGNSYLLQYSGLENSMDYIVQFSSVTQSCPTLWDPLYCSMLGFPVHHQLSELAQTHVYQVDDAIHM